MATNKTQPTKVSVAAFVAALPDPIQRADTKALIQLMKRITGDKPTLWGPSIIGFGTHRYRYESGREGETVLVGFSPRKPALVLYGVAGSKEAATLLSTLGKHSLGKGCLYIKRLADVDLEVLAKMIAAAVATRRVSDG